MGEWELLGGLGNEGVRAGGSGAESMGVQELGQAGCETCGEMRVGGLRDWPDVPGGERELPKVASRALTWEGLTREG